ncbi:ribulose-phosphate 3-epimerase [Liquorilactobacillus oeni]|uniref:Ribulose-phosphate 3-epimerase n=1 Tax=Liquorilactobacillus oeni DSM 19972 TaxID=1423777 RepID=A0A0R1MJN3_9LACO|nr:ribulose-phosphate 3-epimerase [Liquorilactobacillus oeni]KRL04699.1 ribulose-phosphate 3-epimerase [Liquorilactobacillus oeni DSM 19972]
MKIAPSILSADFANLQHEVAQVEQAGAQYLHLDVMDGHFVPNLSFGVPIIKALRPHSKMIFDCHLMVSHPEDYITQLASAGADIIGVHYEATAHIYRLLQLIHKVGCKAEVVLNPGTPLGVLQELYSELDAVLIMTVNPGFGGQKFIPEILDKIERLAHLKKERGLLFEIEVDGGIDDQTIALCHEKGATVAVAGSFIFGGTSPKAQVEVLRKVAGD